MNSNKLRTIVAAAVFVVLSAGLIAGVSMGTLSGFGWETFSALCPLGALATMIATKTVVPRAVVSIVIMAVLVLAVGRAFCGWVCPVPLLDRVRGFFRSPKKRTALEQAKRSEMLGIAKSELGEAAASPERAASQGYRQRPTACLTIAGLLVVQGCVRSWIRAATCAAVQLSTAVFGFPVSAWCAPIGLTSATVLVVWRLFAAGDMTWSVVLIPLLLVVVGVPAQVVHAVLSDGGADELRRASARRGGRSSMSRVPETVNACRAASAPSRARPTSTCGIPISASARWPTARDAGPAWTRVRRRRSACRFW
ncbi:MAG: 4Fe-4S binding protein [Eggerthella lenta]